MKKIILFAACLVLAVQIKAQILPWQNSDLTSEARAADLAGRLTLEEKALLMCDVSEAVPRLGIGKLKLPAARYAGPIYYMPSA